MKQKKYIWKIKILQLLRNFVYETTLSTLQLFLREINAKVSKVNINEFGINHNISVRNYTSEAKWKVNHIIAKEEIYYIIKVFSNIWKRFVDLLTNVDSYISFVNDPTW